MTGKERVLKTLEFQSPDRIPVDLWILPSARNEYAAELEELLKKYPRDILSVAGPCETGYYPQIYENGTWTDFWGCEWTNCNRGVIGEVKGSLLADDAQVAAYKAPIEFLAESWEQDYEKTVQSVADARATGSFVIGGWANPFERMQFLRGVENLYCDIALESDEFYKLREIVWSFYKAYYDRWLKLDIDATVIGDDWGSQRALLINPELWRKLFRPMYADIMQRIQAAGKKVFVHSDGYIYDLYPEYIDLGVAAINSQLWCMDIEKIAENYAGKITFWGELSRQQTMPFGTPEEIREKASYLVRMLHKNGGLIGESEVGKDVPLANIEAVLCAWNA